MPERAVIHAVPGLACVTLESLAHGTIGRVPFCQRYVIDEVPDGTEGPAEFSGADRISVRIGLIGQRQMGYANVGNSYMPAPSSPGKSQLGLFFTVKALILR